MDYYVDTTPFINPVNFAYIAPFQPSGLERRDPERKTLMGPSAFVTSPVDFFTVTTGPLAPTRTPTSQSAPPAEPTPTLTESAPSHAPDAAVPPLNAEIDQIAKQRVRLMAAKYAGGAQTSEIVARLEILNSRLSERAPRISKEQVAALENASDQLVRIHAAREERAKRLGIPTEL